MFLPASSRTAGLGGHVFFLPARDTNQIGFAEMAEYRKAVFEDGMNEWNSYHLLHDVYVSQRRLYTCGGF